MNLQINELSASYHLSPTMSIGFISVFHSIQRDATPLGIIHANPLALSFGRNGTRRILRLRLGFAKCQRPANGLLWMIPSGAAVRWLPEYDIKPVY
jgi:hypothetical protein